MRGHPADGASVDDVGLSALRGAEGQQAYAAGGRVSAPEAVVGPRVGGGRAPQRPPRGAALPGGRPGPVERGLALEAEERVDERGEAEGADGDEAAEELEAPRGVERAGHARQQRSHQVHGTRSPGLAR